MPQAAPAKILARDGFNDFRPNGIQVNVMDDAHQCAGVFHEHGLIAALKKMPPLPPEPVETGRERPLQPVHPVDEIRLWGFERKMEMIAHDRVGVESPSVAFAGFGDRSLERLGCPDRPEYVS